jgi:hypothetical protein
MGPALSWLTGINVMQILDFENVTAASGSRDGTAPGFKSLLKREYGQPEWGDLFDMATGEHLRHSSVVAAHIFQYRWRKFLSLLSSLKGIDDACNGLLLYKPVEWAFDRAKLCIEVNSAGRMTFRLLDQDLRDIKLACKARSLRIAAKRDGELVGRENNLQTTFGDLDRRDVRFPTGSAMRPSKRLLALHAYAAWLTAQTRTPGSDIPAPECDALDDEKTGQAFKFFIDEWVKGVEDARHVSESHQSFRHAILTCHISLHKTNLHYW